MRPSKRSLDQIRDVSIQTGVNKYAEGSCLIKCGETHVLCTASVETRVPSFLRGKGKGWVTAEYSMLPRSTHTRNDRPGIKPNGRALEIQRLIGRSLRSVIDMKKLGEIQITVDCDVLQADGGTRCASITGGYVALALAIKNITERRLVRENPLIGSVSAISCGVFRGEVVADLDYAEDSNCDVDTNFIINQDSNLIEIQGTAENGAMSFEQVTRMYELAKKATQQLAKIQEEAIG